ncbi:bifunctional phosphopantothenoylcysteine decarboxylase/phosphopantothenate synthase [Demequina aurantiaca]|uniref:bifunctional phosphopantothenoylcysteine decarboxylase/phosphopantothenate synthase n=1 Tax=Demequina aurantiaca TaxID=676200 RepID=UPI000780F467|nr:bifunctional phosphopantothenoylcysteine decarboxylase/phosphopantothenate synthase [Demequina aurantiaca]
MRVLLGVTGGIAAYKVAIVLRQLREDGHSVRVVPTAASLNFVGRATWEALSGHPAPTETFEDVPSVAHVRLGQRADIVLVAPATADFLASMAHGSAKDLLGNALLATQAPVVVAPAMHTEMWQNAATQANVATLREHGVHVIDPAVGRLTGADSGPGRLPEPDDLVAALYAVAEGRGLPVATTQADDAGAGSRASDAGWGDLAGVSVVISAGGTHEPVDAVRYLGNRSSGHQGLALAQAAADRGANVTLVAANVVLPSGEGIVRVDVETSAELAEAVKDAAKDADVVIMAAAVADFRPREVSATKIKKTGDATADQAGLTLELVPTEDILAALVAERPARQTVVGFAAETGDSTASVLEHGAAKARRKGANLLVLNAVGGGQGFGDVPNTVTMLDVNGEAVAEASGSKLAVAHAILDRIVSMRS